MEIKVDRYLSNKDSTLGKLSIDGVHECYTCEDGYRAIKEHGKTRIPAGRYRVFLREHGTSRFDESYDKKFDFHKGMLQLAGVPGFEGVLHHIGNTAKDTEGCTLVGQSAITTVNDAGSYGVGGSTNAYKAYYPKVLKALEAGEKVYVTYEDNDRH